MCHTVDFRRRLELDELTAPLADLLLTKMQIVKIGEKDAKDTITLLLDHPLNDSDSKAINYAYISRTLANDWGFYYTVITNLKKLREDFKYLYQEVLPKESTEALHSQITKLLDAIEAEPKSFNWKMRARIGPRKKWYQDVDVQE
jgi:predicted AlkP superfamily phosphohydrolase/phosphomutase